MPLVVKCYAQYRKYEPGDEWRSEDYASLNLIKALKSIAFKGYADVPTSAGSSVRLRSGDRAPALALLSDWAAPLVDAAAGKNGCVLVPVPGSKCTKASKRIGTADELAAAIAAKTKTKARVVCAIRVRKELVAAHEGKGKGPRFADQIFPELVLAEPLPLFSPIVLIDDVLTSGGHLRACKTLLVRNDRRVLLGICAGRTVHDPLPSAWRVPDESLEDWP